MGHKEFQNLLTLAIFY